VNALSTQPGIAPVQQGGSGIGSVSRIVSSAVTAAAVNAISTQPGLTQVRQGGSGVLPGWPQLAAQLGVPGQPAGAPASPVQFAVSPVNAPAWPTAPGRTPVTGAGLPRLQPRP